MGNILFYSEFFSESLHYAQFYSFMLLLPYYHYSLFIIIKITHQRNQLAIYTYLTLVELMAAVEVLHVLISSSL